MSDSLANLINVYENSDSKKAILQFSAAKNIIYLNAAILNTKYALMIGTIKYIVLLNVLEILF